MKLLGKKEIDLAKASDRLRELEEGKKLAKRVDVLRETQVEEEKNLTAYRNKILSETQRMVQQKESELLALEDHVEKLRAEREILFIPLDAEWEKLHRAERQFEKDKEQIGALVFSVSLREEAVDTKEREISVELGRAENLKHLASQDRVHSAQILADTKRDAAQSREHSASILAQADLREQDTLRREADIAARERDVRNRWQRVEEYEASLFKRELTLRESWKSLQETYKEINVKPI